MAKVLMKGNEAIGAAAIKAGCKYFFGYPITPQSELPEYMARELPKIGGVFLQAESEIAAINMVYGAAGAGVRVMTSSSSPGISLKQEGISYIAGAELPCLIVNIMRGGPGLGSIQPSQTDYFQATRGGGNGDYRLVVLAPANVQELVDLIIEGFDIADQYRNPVMILGDGMIGQMMEPVEFKEPKQRNLPEKDWATTGTKGERKPNIINSLYLAPEELEEHNIRLQAKYKTIKENEVKVESYNIEDADVVIAAYGTTSRIARTAISQLEKEGYKVGLIRPITLWPYPYDEFNKISDNCKGILTVEMNTGQMIDDVKIAVKGKYPVYFHGRTGGMVPTPNEIIEKVKEIYGGEK
ncbi:3-methyl-2-oxobutanoate dehydrogenase subunit VorB [Clostridium sp. Cult1]|jgi:2-oxoglutarate ferredoxin oxidoreductase subunit alpha|uniref:3-methyl-2-oxobutanoate dehydrogenase subunit VorB n=1 Tax=Clostridium sp. Cult1 TaxID=2079002 RepID=UPI001F1D98AE|nr:3-methyl-2-oxobutanoate dehydrogenase subunit VorB [Clostridium sp. Cult1]MCF6462310.1 3-methyl-2-oxobutanoate dehydrogenase subunit VorB [Clostridium sp. Cult1]